MGAWAWGTDVLVTFTGGGRDSLTERVHGSVRATSLRSRTVVKGQDTEVGVAGGIRRWPVSRMGESMVTGLFWSGDPSSPGSGVEELRTDWKRLEQRSLPPRCPRAQGRPSSVGLGLDRVGATSKGQDMRTGCTVGGCEVPGGAHGLALLTAALCLWGVGG